MVNSSPRVKRSPRARRTVRCNDFSLQEYHIMIGDDEVTRKGAQPF